METLAYVHLAVVNESPENLDLAADSFDLRSFKKLNLNKLPSSAWIRMGALFISLAILSISSSVLALQKGNQGSQVTALQQSLTAAGFYTGPVTGYYGSLTQTSVSRFQQAKGLRADGIAGASTLAALRGTSVTPINSSFPSGTLLRRGSRGSTVTQLQNALTTAGYYNGPITGYYGRLTETAVSRFQQAKGLRADGIAGSSTLSALSGTSPNPNNPIGTRLQLGSSGQAVTQLQNRLKIVGFYKGPITGSYERLTQAAVRDFQRSRGLPVTGIADTTTVSALQNASPGSSGSSAIVPLQRGSRGSRVRSLQARLIGLGYYTGAKDGVFGPGTEAALKRYQRDKGLLANGIAGATTFASLAPQA